MAGRIVNQQRFGAEDGQALAEYALIIGLVALVCFAAVQGLGTTVSSIIQTMAGAL